MPTAPPEQVAGWFAEALETGNPLAPLPAGTEPDGVEEGERVAAGAPAFAAGHARDAITIRLATAG